MERTIIARRLIGACRVLDYPLVTIENGRVVSIVSLSEKEAARMTATDSFPDATLAPALVDIHMHGCAGRDVMEATPEALRAIGSFLATRGVGAYFPTTVTSSREQTLRALAGLAVEIARCTQEEAAGATPIGIHLEGPFLSHTKKGVHCAGQLELPSIDLFDRFWQASEGRIRLMTIAPELPGAAELIAHAARLGVRCSMGHSNATAEEAKAAFAAGARSATHTFNAMRALNQREPGLTGFVLDQKSLFAEIICDGIHVDPMMVRLFFRSKDAERAILVTDAISATGMPDGTYTLGEMQVEVHNGRCMANGTLAGSVLTLDEGVRNFAEFTGASLQTAVAAATRNPSRLVGIEDCWGTVEEGRVANITVLSCESEVIQTFLAGRPMCA